MADDDDIPRVRLDVDARERDPEGVAPPADDLFRALADRTRRRILWFLLEESRTTVDELVDVLLGWEISESRDENENGNGDGVAGPDQRDRILVSLQHAHLPMLADAGLVSHDPDAGEVRVAPLSHSVRDLVRFGHRYDRTTSVRKPE